MTEKKGPETEEKACGKEEEFQDRILISRSEEIFEERLELCLLRTAEFERSGTAQAGAAFFRAAFRILAERSGGGETAGPAAEKEPERVSAGTSGQEPEELQRLERFWLEELAGLLPAEDGGRKEDLVTAWETTLQLLSAAEEAEQEQKELPVKELKDILYSWLYDYAEERIDSWLESVEEGRQTPEHFLTGFLSGTGRPEHRSDGLALFWGDRLRARLLELLAADGRAGRLKRAAGQRGGGSPVPDPEMPALNSHRQKSLREFLKKAAELGALFLLSLTLAACGDGQEPEETEPAGTAAAEDSAYPGTVAAENSAEKTTDLFGVMHALVLDVQNGEKDGLFVYTLRDDEDPENAWSLNSQSVGDIVFEAKSGDRVSVLFHGDILNDPDAVEFIAILPDADYTIRKTEGTTVSNMMNSFIIRTKKGTELTFIKDNCRVDKDALSTESGGMLTVWYADCGNGELYPVRVYKESGKNK